MLSEKMRRSVLVRSRYEDLIDNFRSSRYIMQHVMLKLQIQCILWQPGYVKTQAVGVDLAHQKLSEQHPRRAV